MLTDKQRRFCDEYLIDLNATQAAIRAGYSEKTAHSIGAENLTKPEIQTYIQDRQRQLQNKLNITQERVLAEYAKIGFFDIRKAYDDNGQLKNIQDLDDNTAGAIAGVESFEEKEVAGEETIITGTNKKLKIWDKRAALDSICKVLGYNAPDKKQVSGELEINGKHQVIIPGDDIEE